MFQKIAVFLFLAVIFIFSSCSKYYRIDESYDKGDFIRAYRILQEITDKKSPHYQRRAYRIVTRLALEGDRDFILQLRALATNEPSPGLAHYAHFSRAYIQFIDAREPARYNSLVSNLSDLKNIPEEFKTYAYKIRGIALYKTGNYQDAIQDLNQSYKLFPYVDNLYFIGLCYFSLEDPKSAAGYFHRVISGTQNGFFISLANFQLGEIEYYQKKYSDALDYYLQAVNRYSGSADYASRIAKCLRKLKYYSIAPKFARIALRIRSDNADAWYFLNMN